MRFIPTETNHITALAGFFEYVRDTAVVNIIDSDRKCLFLTYMYNVIVFVLSALQIQYAETDYYIEEGSEMLNSPITLQFRIRSQSD